MHTYKETIDYLNSFVNYEKIGFKNLKANLDLKRIRDVLECLGHPQKSFKSVHIAGTKGKGSVSKYVASILSEAGYSVGLYTSPHLISPSERISVNGRDISNEEIIEITAGLSKHLGKKAKEIYTFFEVFTLMAMLHFNRKKVDYAVFETGLGGRLDATNVIDSEVCGITPISYDHMDVLGGSIGEIAKEKIEIIKEGSICISSPQRPEVVRLLRSKCSERNAELYLAGKDFQFNITSISPSGTSYDLKGLKREYKGCKTSMPGIFQAANSAVAVGIVEKLFRSGQMPDDASIKKGIKHAYMPARMEMIAKHPLFLLDGAQNGESARNLKYSVEQIYKYDKLILLMGLSRGKDIKRVCDELVPAADEIILTRSSSERSEDPDIIRGYIKGRKVKTTRDSKEALGIAFKLAGKKDLILVAGSFYLAGEIRIMLTEKRTTFDKS